MWYEKLNVRNWRPVLVGVGYITFDEIGLEILFFVECLCFKISLKLCHFLKKLHVCEIGPIHMHRAMPSFVENAGNMQTYSAQNTVKQEMNDFTYSSVITMR
uniref:Uncharacterized protein n=1 Tax=Sphaerodactylus townsendi TaxID=933632 RepID=A0ACB8ED15_9SAUR